MSGAVAKKRSLADRIASIDDGQILRFAFYALLAGCASVLYIDYRELDANAAAMPGLVAPFEPVLPAFDPDGPAQMPGPGVTSDLDALKEPLRISLNAGGVLQLTGTIDPGSGERFAAEVGARGEYVTTVALDSPGGSVTDAMAIGALIHEKGFATSVATGALCASSCPLVFAGGKERYATSASAIGVHQVYAAMQAGELPATLAAAGSAMSDAQRTTATISRHLAAMGVDPSLWLHALETPPDRLYYFSPEELTRYRLVTQLDAGGA
jgi:hypothetical protein